MEVKPAKRNHADELVYVQLDLPAKKDSPAVKIEVERTPTAEMTWDLRQNYDHINGLYFVTPCLTQKWTINTYRDGVWESENYEWLPVPGFELFHEEWMKMKKNAK